MKKATLFGGTVNDTTTKEYKDTVLIGKLLAEKGYIVISGGYRGMMEAVSKGAVENGGTAIGVTCADFKSTKGNKYLTTTVVADNIFRRLRDLIISSDVFIVQKGGIGTLSELFLTWDILRKQDNPLEIYLIGDHWHDIINAIEPLLSDKEWDIPITCKDYKEFEILFE